MADPTASQFYLAPDKPGMIYATLSRGEWLLAHFALLHYRGVLHNPAELNLTTSLITRILEALAEYPDSPYFEPLELDEEEAHHLDNALHLIISESGHALRFGDIAERDVGDKKLSEFAQHRNTFNRMINDLRVWELLWHHEKRIAALEGVLSKGK